MGQFASKEYDGDPYIDLMRALPERELIWWVQKAIWLVEGFTFLDHFGRTYPTLFIHKCQYCNGAGCMTCPSCGGGKLRTPTTAAGALSLTGLGAAAAAQGSGGSSSSSRALVQHPASSAAGVLAGWQQQQQQQAVECQECGGYCDWDEESEWEQKWMDWESKLAYYDRTYGELMNEWYEDVLHEGNLDEDTPHEDAPAPDADETGAIADYDRRKRKYPQLMAALMARFGGHPYDQMDLLPFNVVDPVKRTPLENMWGMGHNRNELPPELHPYNFPELLLLPSSPLIEHDNQVRMEALICRNLDAALRNTRKPYMFEPTAGTVPCPSCYGTPYSASLIPNIGAILRTEVPTWQRVLGRMGRFTTQPDALAQQAGRHFLEYPQQDAAVSVLQQELANKLEGSPPPPPHPAVAARRAIRKGARAGAVGGSDKEEDPQYLEDWGMRGLAADTCGVADLDAIADLPGPHRQPVGGALVSSSVSSPWDPRQSSSSTAGPALAAAMLHDMRRLRQAKGTAQEQRVWQQLQERYSPAALAAMMQLAADANRRGSSSRNVTSSSSAGSSSSSSRWRRQPTAPSEAAMLAEALPGARTRT